MASLPKIYVSFLFGLAVGAAIFAFGVEHGRAMEQPSADLPKVCQPSEPPPQETEPPAEIETLEDVFLSLQR